VSLGDHPGALGDHVPAPVGDQVASPARFHSRMDRSTYARTPGPVELLDHICRRV
jgi:hypothetical protein